MSALASAKKTERLDRTPVDKIDFAALVERNAPVIVPGAAADWPMVQAGLSSPKAAMDYLTPFYSGRPLVLYTLDAEHRGTPFYDETATKMNFEASRVSLDGFFEKVLETFDQDEPKGYYIQSTDAELFFPGFSEENGLGTAADVLFDQAPPMVSLWLGGRTTARAHYDMSNNIAICLAGARRFILFPPDQISNLYPGPLAPSPGGQVITMVDLHDPDLDAHPRFSEALKHAQIADLEPGDLLIYPALWWHQVEAQADFNILMNYWWNRVPNFADSPWTTILHAMLSLRDRPTSERAAWKEVFDYYIFDEPERAAEHLPEAARGLLDPLDLNTARQLRALLLKKLNR